MSFSFATLTPRFVLLLIGATSAAILSAALIGQYFFDLYPCHLCILQRWPHGLVALIGVLGFVFAASPKNTARLLAVCALILLIGAGIATYHAGVESGLFQGPDSCTAGTSADTSLEALRKQIEDAALVSCSQAMAYIFGLSMAAWNALISLGLVMGIGWFLKRKKI